MLARYQIVMLLWDKFSSEESFEPHDPGNVEDPAVPVQPCPSGEQQKGHLQIEESAPASEDKEGSLLEECWEKGSAWLQKGLFVG